MAELEIMRTLLALRRANTAELARATGIGRPTVVNALELLVKKGVLTRSKSKSFSIAEDIYFVILEFSPDFAQTVEYSVSDGAVRRSALKLVPSMSESDNSARLAGLVERHIDKLCESGKRVFASVVTEEDGVRLPRCYSLQMKRSQLVERYLQSVSERASVLYLSLETGRSYLYSNSSYIGCGRPQGKADAARMDTLFSFFLPDTVIFDGRGKEKESQILQIRKTCDKSNVKLLCDDRELCAYELGMIDILLERLI